MMTPEDWRNLETSAKAASDAAREYSNSLYELTRAFQCAVAKLKEQNSQETSQKT